MCIKWLCVSLCVCVKWVCVSLCMCFVLLFLHSMRVQCEWVVQINTVGVFCVFRCEKQFSVNLRPPCYYEPLVCRLLSFLATFPSVLLTEPCFSTSHFLTPPTHTFIFFYIDSFLFFFSPPFLTFLSTFIGCIWCPVILHALGTAINCFFSVSLNIIGQKRKTNAFLHTLEQEELFYIESENQPNSFHYCLRTHTDDYYASTNAYAYAHLHPKKKEALRPLIAYYLKRNANGCAHI